MSGVKKPSWFQDFRIENLTLSKSLELPESRFTQFKGLDINTFKDTWDQFDEIKNFYRVSGLNGGVEFYPLFDLIQKEGDGLIEKYLQGIRRPKDKLEALHYAYINSGYVLSVRKGWEGEIPIIIKFQVPGLSFPIFHHTVIVVESGSNVQVVEEIVGGEGVSYFSHILEVYMEENSSLDYGYVESFNPSSIYFSRKFVELKRYSKVDTSSIWMGAKLVQNENYNYYRGEGSEVVDKQVFLAAQREHYDLSSFLFHEVPFTQGYVLIQGAVKDRARAVLRGMIRIEPGAQKTNSYLEEHALILNKGAFADTEPGLEINADDVRCTHGATVSRVDEEKMFYLMSRGLTREKSLEVLTRGYLEPAVEKIRVEYLISRLDELFRSKWYSSF